LSNFRDREEGGALPAPEQGMVHRRPETCRGRAFHILADIKITSGTNTKVKTTNFVASAFQTMSEILGPLHDAAISAGPLPVDIHNYRASSCCKSQELCTGQYRQIPT
jgi:hypothetical protein